MASGSKLGTLLLTPRRAAAARLRRARLALGLTQEQVPAFAKARGCEVSERTVRDLERGRVRMTALELAIVLEAAASGGSHAPATGNTGAAGTAVGHHLELVRIAAAPEPRSLKELGVCVDGPLTDSAGSCVYNEGRARGASSVGETSSAETEHLGCSDPAPESEAA